MADVRQAVICQCDPASERLGWTIKQRLLTYLIVVVYGLPISGCDGPAPVRNWPLSLENTAPYRGSKDGKDVMNEQSLNLAIAAYDREFKARFGAHQYYEFAVKKGDTFIDVSQQIRDARMAEGSIAVPPPIRSGAATEVEVWQSKRNSKHVILLVWIADVDPARDNDPPFVLVFESKL